MRWPHPRRRILECARTPEIFTLTESSYRKHSLTFLNNTSRLIRWERWEEKEASRIRYFVLYTVWVSRVYVIVYTYRVKIRIIVRTIQSRVGEKFLQPMIQYLLSAPRGFDTKRESERGSEWGKVNLTFSRAKVWMESTIELPFRYLATKMSFRPFFSWR